MSLRTNVKQSRGWIATATMLPRNDEVRGMDCFVVLLLAMTGKRARNDEVRGWIASSLMLLAMTRKRARNDEKKGSQ